MAESDQAAAQSDERGPMQRVVERFFLEEGWPAFATAEGVKTMVNGENGSFPLYVLLREPRGILLCYAVAPKRASHARRVAAARLAGRITYGLHVGTFECDESDGEGRVRASLDISGLQLFPTLEEVDRQTDAAAADAAANERRDTTLYGLLASLVYPAVMILDEYLPAWNAVCDGRSPDQALAIVEHRPPAQ